jgi:hypothetical protein
VTCYPTLSLDRSHMASTATSDKDKLAKRKYQQQQVISAQKKRKLVGNQKKARKRASSIHQEGFVKPSGHGSQEWKAPNGRLFTRMPARGPQWTRRPFPCHPPNKRAWWSLWFRTFGGAGPFFHTSRSVVVGPCRSARRGSAIIQPLFGLVCRTSDRWWWPNAIHSIFGHFSPVETAATAPSDVRMARCVWIIMDGL